MRNQKNSTVNQINESTEVVIQLKSNRKIVKLMQDPNQPLYCTLIEFPYFPYQSMEIRKQLLEPISEEICFYEMLKQPEILRIDGYDVHKDCVCLKHEKINNILPMVVKKLTYPQKISLFYDVVRGIKAIHGKGILHRGIQPSNIGVCEHEHQLQAKIISFQNAIVTNKYGFVEGESENVRKCGNNCYTAPEILRGENHSFACDVWSLGILLDELLFGLQVMVELKREGLEI